MEREPFGLHDHLMEGIKRMPGGNPLEQARAYKALVLKERTAYSPGSGEWEALTQLDGLIRGICKFLAEFPPDLLPHVEMMRAAA